MALGICIPGLIAQGKIPPARATEILTIYEEFLAQYDGKMARASAEAMATEKALKFLDRAALDKKRQAFLQLRAQAGWLDDMKMRSADGGPIDHRIAVQKMAQIDKKIDVVRGSLFATMDAMLAKHRRNVLGQVRNKSDLENVGRELFGESSGDVNARELADAMGEVMELARTRANQAGANIAKLDSYGLPQRHDPRAVRAVSFEEWRAHPSIERVKVRDIETGDIADGVRRETILRDVYESIRTDGANKAKPGAMFGGSLANRRGDPRVLHFESFADWTDYQARFGSGDSIYDIFVGHIGAMAREIALMEELGPNPAATLRFQKEWLEKSTGQSGSQRDIDRVNGRTGKLQSIYDELTGANKLPDNRSVALGFSALRSQQVAAKLGSAVLSAVPDFAMLLHNARFNRVPVMKTLGQYVKLWNPLDDGDRRLAVRLGLVTDDWLGLSSSSARYTGEELTGEVSRRMAEIVIRGQGLARHTRNGQWAFGMEFLSHLTQMSDRGFGALDPQLQKQMQRYGINESDWDAYRATDPRIERGSDWIMPTDAGKPGQKVLEMVLSETDFAIIMPDVRTRSTINSFGQPGSWKNEIFKTAFLFKSFPLTIMNLHGRRMIESSTWPHRLHYAVPLLGLMVAGGALSAQLKTVGTGKDPQPMNDIKFLGKAIAQSGGLGLFGDLLYNSQNSYGGGITATLAGPILGQTLPNAVDATAGNIFRAIDGDEKSKPEFTKDIVGTLEKEIPGRNLWYTRLAYERIIAESIREWSDPDSADAYKRMEKRAAEEGTQFYAPPGAGLSGFRAPEFANAFAEVQE